MKELLLVGMGGFLGSVARYLLSLATGRWLPSHIPVGTFVANLLGCLLIGIVIGLGYRAGWITRGLFLLLATGFCGGFTTFSTFSSESLHLINSGQYALAAMYLAGSVLLGLLAVWLGIYLGK